MPKGRIEKLILKGVLWLVILALIAFAVFLFGSAWGVYQKERAAKVERDAAASVNADLLERKGLLEHDLEALNSDRGVEEEIRERYPVVKEGEEIIILVDAKDPVISEEPEKKEGFFGGILDLFSF